MSGTWVDDDNVALLTDLYELNMLQAYFNSQMNDIGVFDLFVRRLPPERNYLVACGLDDVLRYLESLHFSEDAVLYLRSLGTFSPEFLDYLQGFRFTGDVYAVAEGSIIFANEPILEVAGPLLEAQLVESCVMNQIHLQTLAASKAARVVTAAAGRTVVDFGLRRIHGADAAIKAARAFYVAGVNATSNVLAGQLYGIPVAGTMAHSFVQAHDNEVDAFLAFAKTFPGTILLIDTYDTLEGAHHVVDLKRRLGDNFKISAVRLDSGNLDVLSRQVRRILDAAGLRSVEIFASSSLDERKIAQLVTSGCPIDGFGVGTHMGVSSDTPSLDMVYKLVEYAGQARMKLSENKSNLPGRKQVFRLDDRDVIGLAYEQIEGEALLQPVMTAGRRLTTAHDPIGKARENFKRNRDRFSSFRKLVVSEEIAALIENLRTRV